MADPLYEPRNISRQAKNSSSNLKLYNHNGQRLTTLSQTTNPSTHNRGIDMKPREDISPSVQVSRRAPPRLASQRNGNTSAILQPGQRLVLNAPTAIVPCLFPRSPSHRGTNLAQSPRALCWYLNPTLILMCRWLLALRSQRSLRRTMLTFPQT